ncbi:hypothetical protein AWB76_00934 [Caballeronia temeraria]|uniref:Uncharacterized protein n=1 Tax=Caballeronia temeraria TaxID=1777137 RepID=A0A157ZM04_9BURK|nr:hypothetical protein [Caballeronia temeraria]SAK46554.1 hypothetical protein AWB76_00934 [Caballeronia temeraria]
MQTATSNNWWREALETAAIYALAIYVFTGFCVIYMIFTEPVRSTSDYWVIGLVGAPVGLYFGWMAIIRPLLIALAAAFVIFLRCLPLIIAGFLLGVGYFLAMRIL